MGRWVGGIRERHVECDRLHNEFFVCSHSGLKSSFILRGKILVVFITEYCMMRICLNFLYFLKVMQNPKVIARKDWDAWDPMLISEGLFSAANIFR